MKILFVHNYPLKTGGVSLLNLELTEYLKNKGYQVKIFSPQIEENFDFVEKNFKNLKNLVFESDLVILNPSPYLWPAISKTFYYLKKFNKKYLVWFHIILDSKVYSSRYQDYPQRLQKLTEILNSENCQRIICVSKSVANSLKEIVLNKEKIKIIYPGVRIFSSFENLKRKDLIFAGRFSEEKNLATLIKAFCIVALKNKSVNLTLIGEGKEEKNLRNLIKKFKLEKRIEIIPPLSKEKLHSLIQNHKILINPSIIESLSLISIESLLLETPVILSKNPGHLEIAQNGRFGLLFDPYNEKDLAEKIIFGLENYNKLEQKIKKAKKILKNKFSYRKNWRKYEGEILKTIFHSKIYLPKTNFVLSSAFVV